MKVMECQGSKHWLFEAGNEREHGRSQVALEAPVCLRLGQDTSNKYTKSLMVWQALERSIFGSRFSD